MPPFAIALLIKLENQPRHDERLAAPCCHIEQEVQGIGFPGEVVLVAVDEARKGFYLIGAQFIALVQILSDAVGDFFPDSASLGKSVQLFIEK